MLPTVKSQRFLGKNRQELRGCSAETGYMASSSTYVLKITLTSFSFVFQGRGASLPSKKTPSEEDFETIKLISNGAYG